MNPTDSSSGNQPRTLNCSQCCLKDFSVFKDCPSDLLNRLFENKEFRKYKKNETLVIQDELFKGVFCIQEGAVKASTLGNKNKEFILWFAHPGDVIGLNSLISNEPYSFSALAMEPVSACFIPASDFKELISKKPTIARKLMQDMCEKINVIEDRILSISMKKIREQFAEMLISIATKNKRSIGGTMPINYSIKDLANMIGTTNNYLYKILSEFNNKNVISIRNKKLVIKDLDRLSLIAIGEESIT